MPISSKSTRSSLTIENEKFILNDKTWLFAKQENEEWTFKIMTLLPDDLKDVRKSGILMYEDLVSSKLTYVNYFENKMISKKQVKQVYASSSSKVALAKKKTCRKVWIETCLDGTDICSTNYREICEDVVIDPEWTDFPPLDDGGCLGCAVGGGGSGGGGSGTGTGTATIKNNVNNPCLKSMVDAILSKNIEFEAGKSLKAIFDINDTFNLNFTETASLDNATGGVAIGNSVHINNTMTKLNVEIQLNGNTLPNASQEYIATVIIHEAVHAYLYSTGNIGKLLDEFNNIHHDIMWTSYVDFISNYLVSNYRTPESDANSLAMEGLQKTFGSNLADKIADIRGARILPSDSRADINEKYRKGEKGVKCE